MATESDLRKGFVLGPWEVLPDRGLLRDGDKSEHLEPLVMRVLVALACVQGDVLSKDELIEIVWNGRALSDEPLNRCVSLLRRKLGDDSRNPTYIQNIPRLGYRLMMPIQVPSAASPPVYQETARNRGRMVRVAGAIALVAAVALGLGVRGFINTNEQRLEMGSVAIYPFTCAGITEEYLCFGFSEELTSTLLHSAQIKIVKFREPLPTDRTPKEIAAALGVDGLLTGSVQQFGDSLKISAELIDAESGFTTFSETIEGLVSEVFDLQESTASRVAQEILGVQSEPLLSVSRPGSFEAFEAYARGQYQFERRSRASIEESIRLFEESIRLDPMFGPAYLRLAYAYLLLPEYDSSLSIQAMYDQAAATTEAGIAADPEIRELAGTVFGFIHHKRGEWAEANAAFELAVNADTVFPVTRNWYSRFLATVGRLDDALAQAQMAYEQAPDDATIISRLAITNLWVGDLGAAGRYFDIANSMGQENPIHDLAYALYLIRMEDIATARRFTKKGLEKYGLDSAWVDPVYDGLEDPARRAQSVALVAELEAEGGLLRYQIMALWAVLGEADRAFETAMSINGIGQDFETVLEVMFSDDLRNLRRHSDFQKLLEATGLTAYWSQIGCEWMDDRVRCE
jgi:DNA-binding winged helix-turn-helix (wHTH) protein/TolB-like protein/Tfp pilus assembly protein PilF